MLGVGCWMLALSSMQPSREPNAAAPRRSVFGNYQAPAGGSAFAPNPAQPAAGAAPLPGSLAGPATLQASIDQAIARSFLHRWIARAFEDPDPEGWPALVDPALRADVDAAVRALAADRPDLAAAAREWAVRLAPDGFACFSDDYLACFGHTVRGDCPMNEIEYGDIKADPLFQPHRLADLGAFYAAFGLELAPDAGQRQDHICIELEFMSVLAAKEAYALEHQLDDDPLALVRDAQKKFLREHLGRWTPAFTRRLSRMAEDGALGALARFTGAFIAAECARFGVAPGDEDLLLRPVDEAAERLCAQCGLAGLGPGVI